MPLSRAHVVPRQQRLGLAKWDDACRAGPSQVSGGQRAALRNVPRPARSRLEHVQLLYAKGEGSARLVAAGAACQMSCWFTSGHGRRAAVDQCVRHGQMPHGPEHQDESGFGFAWHPAESDSEQRASRRRNPQAGANLGFLGRAAVGGGQRAAVQ